MKKTTTKMMSGGKATAKKMSGGKTYKMGGKTTLKKKAVGGVKDGGDDPVMGGCPKGGKCAPGTRPKMSIGQKIKNAFGGSRIKKVRV